MASLLPFELRSLRGVRRVYARDLCLHSLSRRPRAPPLALFFTLHLPSSSSSSSSNTDTEIYRSELCHPTPHPLWQPLPPDLVERYGDLVQLTIRLYATLSASHTTRPQVDDAAEAILTLSVDMRDMFYAGATVVESNAWSGTDAVDAEDALGERAGGRAVQACRHATAADASLYAVGFLYWEYDDGVFGTPLPHPSGANSPAPEPTTTVTRTRASYTCPVIGAEVRWLRSPAGRAYYIHDDTLTAENYHRVHSTNHTYMSHEQLHGAEQNNSTNKNSSSHREMHHDEKSINNINSNHPANEANCNNSYNEDSNEGRYHYVKYDADGVHTSSSVWDSAAVGDTHTRHILTVEEMDGLALGAASWSAMEQLAQARIDAQVTQMQRCVATGVVTERAVARRQRCVLRGGAQELRRRARRECAVLQCALDGVAQRAKSSVPQMSSKKNTVKYVRNSIHAATMDIDAYSSSTSQQSSNSSSRSSRSRTNVKRSSSSSSSSSDDARTTTSSDEYEEEQVDAAVQRATAMRHAELRAQLARLRECRTRELRAAFPIHLAAPSHLRSRCNHSNNNNHESHTSGRALRHMYDTIAGLRLPFFAVHEMTDMTRPRGVRTHTATPDEGDDGADALLQSEEAAVGRGGAEDTEATGHREHAPAHSVAATASSASVSAAAAAAVAPTSSLTTSLLAVALPVTMWTSASSSADATRALVSTPSFSSSASSSAAVLYEEGLALSYAALVLRTLAVLYNCALPYPVILAGSKSRVLVAPDIDVARATAAVSVGRRGGDVKLPLYCTRAAERPRLVRAVRLLMYNARVLAGVMGRGEDVLVGCNLRIAQALCILLDPDYRF